jgi:predicted ATPase/class 3 adenylate cyclase
MVEQPSGTVTLVLTDIEGSTRLLHELGRDAYREALAEHRLVVREACARHAGYEVDYEGDAFFYAFSSASAALAAVSEAMRSLETGPIRIRVGIHTGEPGLDPPKYVGLDVHLAARIVAAGHGGQVLVSQTTRDLLDDRFVLCDLGEHRLKDLAGPQRLYQLLIDGLHDRFPALKTLENRPTNLPVQPTALIGREAELAEVCGLLRSDGARLLTLVGTGGSGKTRVALQVGAELLDDFRNGVFFVPLAAVSDPDFVLPTIAQALSLHQIGGELREALAAYLSEKEMLLVLDNFEQILPAAPALGGLLQQCPRLRLLVTSRAVLRVGAEQVYEVPPLPELDAVELFVERARAASSAFEPDPEIAEICRRLDGLPLAIELAAARVRVLSTPELLRRLDERLPLLTGGARDAPERQQTLRATIQWSYDLLSEWEARLFRRLAVFTGGWTLDAAKDAAGADVDTLQSLVEKSLVRHSGERFGMLETIREYAAERLEGSGEADELKAGHARWFLAVAEEAEPYLRGAEQGSWLRRLDDEHENLRTALAYLAASDQPELELRLAGSLVRFWYVRSHLSEGRIRLENALARSGRNPDRFLDKALYGAGLLAERQGDYERAEALVDERLALCRTLGDGGMIAAALLGSAVVAIALGRDRQGSDYYIECVDLARLHGAKRTLAMALGNLGDLAEREGDYERARQYCEEGLALFRELSDTHLVAIGLAALGSVALKQGRSSEARAFQVEGLQIAHELEDKEVITWCLESLAAQAAAEKQPDRAARLLAAADRLHEETGFAEYPNARQQNERTRATLEAELDQQRLTEALAQGRQMTLDEIVTYALRGESGRVQAPH